MRRSGVKKIKCFGCGKNLSQAVGVPVAKECGIGKRHEGKMLTVLKLK